MAAPNWLEAMYGPPLLQDEGLAVPVQPTLNFMGAGVTVTDDAANARTLITIPGGGAGSVPTGTGLYKVLAGAMVSAAALLVNADVSASAAIAGTKISPDFGAQNILTSGTINGGAVSGTSLTSSGSVGGTSAAFTGAASAYSLIANPAGVTMATLGSSLVFAEANAGAGISVASRTSDADPQGLAISGAGPWASATTNKGAGAISISTAAPLATGVGGSITISTATSPTAGLGGNVSISTEGGSGGALTVSAAAGSSFSQKAGQALTLGSSSGASTVVVQHGTGALEFGTAVAAPTLRAATQVSDAAPLNLTISSGAPFGTATTNKGSGNLTLQTPQPLAGGTQGALVLDVGAQATATSLAASGDIRSRQGIYWRFRNSANTADLQALMFGAGNGVDTVTLGNNAGIGGAYVQGASRAYVSGSASSIDLQSTYTELIPGAGLFRLGAAVTSPTFTQAQHASAGGQALKVAAQSAFATGAFNGGTLQIVGGAKGSTGLQGGVQIGVGNAVTGALIEVAEVVSGSTVIALGKAGAVTATEMPSGTGSGVVFLANATTAPTVNPASGGVLYGTGGGLGFRSSGGGAFTSSFLTAATATAGAVTPPALVVGYLICTIGGTTAKIPYYAN